MNDLLATYKGPVLVAQGVLDPLNNATDRANLFESIRGDIEVERLQLGHCPMDEDPELVTFSRHFNVLKFWNCFRLAQQLFAGRARRTF